MDSDFNLYKRQANLRPSLPKEGFFSNDPYELKDMSQDVLRDGAIEITKRNNDLSSQIRESTAIYRDRGIKHNRTLARKLENRMGWVRPNDIQYAHSPLEEHADHIVSCMEQDTVLMEDNPSSEQLRMETLRDMPQCLTVKRQIKVKLSKSVSNKSKHKRIGFYKQMKYRTSIVFTRLKNNIKSVLYNFELWYNSLKIIEGHFGSAIATHFKFLRWLFIMNLLICVPTIALIIVPQLCHRFFVIDENSRAVSVNSNPYKDNEFFQFKDIFLGGGYFTNTTMFYGFYTNETLNWVGNSSYSMPQAYFFTMICLYLTCFIVLSLSMAQSYRHNFIETKGGLKNVYAYKIFCGWDFSIATKEAAELKSIGIYQELKELLSDMKFEKHKKPLFYKVWKGAVHFLMNIAILAFLCGVGFLMWKLLNTYNNNMDYVETHALITSVVVNVIMIIVPMVFSFITKYEGYKSPRVVLFITLGRTFLLEIIILGVLLGHWLRQARSKYCWETLLGQEMYRLIIFDFIIALVFGVLLEIGRYVCYKYLWQKIGLPEFDIARYTVHIIYNQTLFWIGFFFSPWLSVIVVIKLLCTWYIRKFSVMHFCKPSSKSWRASQTQTWFFILSFITLLFVLALYGFIIVEVSTSSCGPFRNYNYIYQMVLEGTFKLKQDHAFWKIIMFIVKPGVIALILIAMCVRVYYLRAKSLAQKGMVDMLREMLVWESRDKEFLLKYISKVTQGQWQYNLQESRGSVTDPVRLLPSHASKIREQKQKPTTIPNTSGTIPAAELDELRRRFRQT